MKSHELTVITHCTKDAPDVEQIILNSFQVFMKKELHSIAAFHAKLYDT